MASQKEHPTANRFRDIFLLSFFVFFYQYRADNLIYFTLWAYFWYFNENGGKCWRKWKTLVGRFTCDTRSQAWSWEEISGRASVVELLNHSDQLKTLGTKLLLEVDLYPGHIQYSYLGCVSGQVGVVSDRCKLTIRFLLLLNCLGERFELLVVVKALLQATTHAHLTICVRSRLSQPVFQFTDDTNASKAWAFWRTCLLHKEAKHAWYHHHSARPKLSTQCFDSSDPLRPVQAHLFHLVDNLAISFLDVHGFLATNGRFVKTVFQLPEVLRHFRLPALVLSCCLSVLFILTNLRMDLVNLCLLAWVTAFHRVQCFLQLTSILVKSLYCCLHVEEFNQSVLVRATQNPNESDKPVNNTHTYIVLIVHKWKQFFVNLTKCKKYGTRIAYCTFHVPEARWLLLLRFSERARNDFFITLWIEWSPMHSVIFSVRYLSFFAQSLTW